MNSGVTRDRKHGRRGEHDGAGPQRDGSRVDEVIVVRVTDHHQVGACRGVRRHCHGIRDGVRRVRHPRQVRVDHDDVMAVINRPTGDAEVRERQR